jgi:hypothetical protein
MKSIQVLVFLAAVLALVSCDADDDDNDTVSSDDSGLTTGGAFGTVADEPLACLVTCDENGLCPKRLMLVQECIAGCCFIVGEISN